MVSDFHDMFFTKLIIQGGESMKIVNKAIKVKVVKEMKKDARVKFNACSPDRCPRCRISDG